MMITDVQPAGLQKGMQKMKSYLPIEIKPSPITKLVLIPFEKTSDTIYNCFELQYIDGAPYGKGYRVIAYRRDQYVDVYDDEALNFLADETFHVTGKGLHRHVQTPLKNVIFCREQGRQNISFAFTDLENREIQVYIAEKSNRKTIPMNLLAPVGSGSASPNFLPVFFMYEFDFIRRKNTEISCRIADREIPIDPFPFPMNGQFRWYARYSTECELLEFATTDSAEIKEVELDGQNIYRNGNVEYIFERENVLEKIKVHFGNNTVQILFTPGLDLTESCHGSFQIRPREQMGYLQGEYQVRTEKETAFIMGSKGKGDSKPEAEGGQKTVLTMCPTEGWISAPNSFITRKIFSKNSVFCKWSRKYQYKSVFNWEAKERTAVWKNGNIETEKEAGEK